MGPHCRIHWWDGSSSGGARVETLGQIHGAQRTANSDRAVTRHATIRFAVAPFNTWLAAEAAARELGTGDHPLTDISYLGLKAVLLVGGASQALCELPFPDNGSLIACTEGPVAERLRTRLDTGDSTLQVALSQWLIPRHAAHLQRAVEQDKIIVWVGLLDSDDELRAYRSLLATGSISVGVHDLV